MMTSRLVSGVAATADLIGLLAEPSEAVAAARAAKPNLIKQAQAAHDALFAAAGRIDAPMLHALVARVAEQQGAPGLAAFHRGEPAADLNAGDEAIGALVRFADIVSLAPALATPEDIQSLAAHGFGPADVVLVAQAVAITSFQAHLIAGLRLLSGHELASIDGGARETADVATVPERSKYHPGTAPNGRPSPAGFTTDPLGWEPWVAPIPPGELTEAERASFATKPNIPYFRLLARQPEILIARTDVDDAIFELGDDLPRAERELLAAVTSRVNDCVFCASVHARRAETMSGRVDEVRSLLAASLDRAPAWQPGALDALRRSTGDARWSALIDFGAALAASPSRADAAQVDRLRGLGLTDAELVDAVSAVAFFSWANRLMLTLGEPFVPARGRGDSK